MPLSPYELLILGRRFSKSAFWLFVFITFSGCIPFPHPDTPSTQHPKASATFPKRVAVLPVSNQSGNPDGSLIVRALVLQKLEKDFGMSVQKLEETEQIIHERTLTGPEIPVSVALARQDAGVLTTWLGVDGILETRLTAFNQTQLTVYQQTQVKAHFVLKDRSGKPIWTGAGNSDAGGIRSGGCPSAALESALMSSHLPAETMERMGHSPLAEAALEMVDEAFSNFPEP
jgi:hypothetical protein